MGKEARRDMKALVTGASSGLGRDIVRVLDRRRIETILVARRQDRLLALQGQLQHVRRVIPLDLSQRDNCRRLYEQVRGEDIDILINDAGFGVFGDFDHTDLDRELQLLDVNIGAVHILTKLFLRDFVRRDAGYILNVSSSSAYLPGPRMAAYYASKAYVLRLTESIMAELRHRGSHVYVGALCPGPVHTEFDRVAHVTFHLPYQSSREVAEEAVRRLFARRPVMIPSPLMKAARVAERLLPEMAAGRIDYYMQSRGQ